MVLHFITSLSCSKANLTFLRAIFQVIEGLFEGALQKKQRSILLQNESRKDRLSTLGKNMVPHKYSLHTTRDIRQMWVQNNLIIFKVYYLHLVLRFWNQVLTWASVILRFLANVALSVDAKYFCLWNLFSSSQI